MNRLFYITNYCVKKNLLSYIATFIFIVITNSVNAEILKNPPTQSDKNSYYNKYAEIILKFKNGKRSTIKVYGTSNTSVEGFNKYLDIIDNIFDKSLIEDGPKTALNNVKFYLVNAGDYIESMPNINNRGETLQQMFRNVARAVINKEVQRGVDGKLYLDIIVVVSEEYFCKVGLLTRYFTQKDKDHIVYRMDAVIHEVGHFLDYYYSLTDKMKNSVDYANVYANYKDHHLAEVAPMLIQAWFDSNNMYPYMPRNRAELKAKFPNFYQLFKSIFNENVKNIKQNCANSSSLDSIAASSNHHKLEFQHDVYGIYPESIINDHGVKVPNYLQSTDSLYQLNYNFVIGNNVCLEGGFIEQGTKEIINDCAKLCSSNLKCKGYIYNTSSKMCSTLAKVDCPKGTYQGYKDNFQFSKINLQKSESASQYGNNSTSVKLSANSYKEFIFWLIIIVILIFSILFLIKTVKAHRK